MPSEQNEPGGTEPSIAPSLSGNTDDADARMTIDPEESIVNTETSADRPETGPDTANGTERASLLGARETDYGTTQPPASSQSTAEDTSATDLRNRLTAIGGTGRTDDSAFSRAFRGLPRGVKIAAIIHAVALATGYTVIGVLNFRPRSSAGDDPDQSALGDVSQPLRGRTDWTFGQ